MFESPVAESPAVVRVRSLTADLMTIHEDLNDAERVDLLRALEELKCAGTGAQAAVTADFAASQRGEQAAAGVRAERQGRGIRRSASPRRGSSTQAGPRDRDPGRTASTSSRS